MAKKDTRLELINSAMIEFAQNGYDKATTRDIAKRANINLSSILYYFGGKQGIYKATLETIVQKTLALTEDINTECANLKKSKDEKKAYEVLKEFIDRFLSILCGKKISKYMLEIFLNEYAHQSENFHILYEGLVSPFQKIFAELIVLASSKKMPMEDAILYSFPFFAQLFVFASRKNTICQTMNWQDYEETQIKKAYRYIIYQIDFVIQNYK